MTQEQPTQLDRLEATVARFAEYTMQNIVRHDQALERLEASAARHDEALDRVEGAIANLTNRIDALTTSTTETMQLVALNSQQIARSEARIEEILEYLWGERPNGRGSDSP